jgi:hypothetical protein
MLEFIFCGQKLGLRLNQSSLPQRRRPTRTGDRMKKTITLTVEQINALEVFVERGIEEFKHDIADYGSDPQEIAANSARANAEPTRHLEIVAVSFASVVIYTSSRASRFSR